MMLLDSVATHLVHDEARHDEIPLQDDLLVVVLPDELQ